jgi:asparagine synthase (glutamine-hydrolysing)
VRRMLLDGHARIYDVMDRKVVASLIEQHLRGEKNKRLMIWSLLNVESWMTELL